MINLQKLLNQNGMNVEYCNIANFKNGFDKDVEEFQISLIEIGNFIRNIYLNSKSLKSIQDELKEYQDLVK